MERFFDTPLDGARLVSDAVAPPGALAWATGETIGLAPGAPRPDSAAGARLLGHELTHLMQQRFGRVSGSGAGLTEVRAPRLEAEADAVGDVAAAVLTGRRPLVPGEGRRLMGLAGAAPRAGEAPVVQFQEFGQLNKWVFLMPDDGWRPTLKAGLIIYHSTASTNETFETRARAFQRAKDRNDWISGNAQRTYFANEAHEIRDLGQGNLFRYMEDRREETSGSYGRYYDHGDRYHEGGRRKLTVEHDSDPEARLIEVVSVSAGLAVRYRRWATVPHFHMAAYTGMDRFDGNRSVVGDCVNGPPPSYEQEKVPKHHIYYIDPSSPNAPTIEQRPLGPFRDAFERGAQAVFTLVWPGGG
jgi:hypothetical protein